MIDTATQRKKSLERIGDVCLNLLGRHAGVKRRDHYHWNIDVGKKVDGHASDRGYADYRDDQADRDN
jgi:hypothetical protein